MSKLAHTHNSLKDIAIHEEDKFTLLLRRHDGKFDIASTKDMPNYLNEEVNVVSMAMQAVCHHDEKCDVYYYGEYFGTAKYVDMTPDCWFSSMQVVFSTFIDY